MALDCRILTEDGGALLQEDGTSDLLLENCTPASGGTDTGCDLLTEDGGLLLQEDGISALLLETCTNVVISPTGGGFLIPAVRIPLQDDELEVATALLALLRKRRWTIE